MPPTIILIRHGEAYHNATLNYELRDPGLTDEGKQQCRRMEEWLQKELPMTDEVEAIVSSPMIRTLETTFIGLDWLIQRGIDVEIDALWQGWSLLFLPSLRRRIK